MDSHKFNIVYETVPQIWKRHYIFSSVKFINLVKNKLQNNKKIP